MIKKADPLDAEEASTFGKDPGQADHSRVMLRPLVR
jgi:hypothetical protein